MDIKAVHGYLISELLGAKTREGRYGGALENRLRFIRNVIGKLRAAFGNRLMIAIRMNAFDGVPFGCDFRNSCIRTAGAWIPPIPCARICAK